MFPLRNFPDCHHAPNPHSANLFLGYKVSLVHAVFGIDPSSILRSPFPHCNSSWIKIGFFFFYWFYCCPALGFFWQWSKPWHLWAAVLLGDCWRNYCPISPLMAELILLRQVLPFCSPTNILSPPPIRPLPVLPLSAHRGSYPDMIVPSEQFRGLLKVMKAELA